MGLGNNRKFGPIHGAARIEYNMESSLVRSWCACGWSTAWWETRDLALLKRNGHWEHVGYKIVDGGDQDGDTQKVQSRGSVERRV